MNPITFALRRPRTILVLMIALIMTGLLVIRPRGVDDWLRERGVELPLQRMAVDIFPA